MGTATLVPLVLIDHPRFEVRFRRPSNAPSSTQSAVQRTERAVLHPFELIKIIFVALGTATYSTFRHAGTSFKHNVLGYYGSWSEFHPPADIYLAVFKIIFWVAGMGWSIVATTARLIYQKLRDPEDDRLLLDRFTGEEIDPTHLTVQELAIDMREVPADVKIDQLAAMFEEINFDHPNEPGYMAPSSRREGENEYTALELKRSLDVFIDYVKRRVAFLGTPPSYDMPRLLAFYQQIEDAVRFTIHKVNGDLVKFRKEKGTDVSQYSEQDQRKYKDLLEDRARVAINLAIAGKHCGARFMGESMELYNAFNSTSPLNEGTLREALIVLLAAKRRAIAEAQIQQHFGSEVHAYSNYMATMGPLLGIPGTKNIVEHLSRPLDRSKYLAEFFKAYTVDEILKTIQDAYKTSGAFRQKMIAWVRDQKRDWAPESKVPLLISQIQPILAEQNLALDSSRCQAFAQLQELVRAVGAQDLPAENFAENLFSLPGARAWFERNPNVMERAQLKESLRTLLKDLGHHLIAGTRDALKAHRELRVEDFAERLLELQKVERIRALIHIPEETLIRVVRGERPIEQVLRDAEAQAAAGEFLSALKLDEMVNTGLSPEMLEWIVVEHSILLAQRG